MCDCLCACDHVCTRSGEPIELEDGEEASKAVRKPKGKASSSSSAAAAAEDEDEEEDDDDDDDERRPKVDDDDDDEEDEDEEIEEMKPAAVEAPPAKRVKREDKVEDVTTEGAGDTSTAENHTPQVAP